MNSQTQDSGHQPSHRLLDERTGRHFLVRNQASDIDTCVAFSYVRGVLSLISILLAITDIPRTGLVVDLSAHYPSVAPGIVMYYGPFAYPTVHLNKTDCSSDSGECAGTSIAGYSGARVLQFVKLWAYKFDSLSIPTRALAQHLNVSTYPSCVFYDKPCQAPTLAVDTVFAMLSDLISATQERYFASESIRDVPVVFKTVSFWADRLHHVLLGELGYRTDHRTHTVHFFTTPDPTQTGTHEGLNICRPQSAADRHRPMVCTLLVEWLSEHPTLGSGTQIPVYESINLRFAALQQQYPDAQLDLTMISSKSGMHNHKIAFMPTVYYSSDTFSITTLIRGRRCRAGKACTVEFLDDYRYERAIVESSSEEMKTTTRILRGSSQLYVWLRVLLLGFVCCKARLAETSHRFKSAASKLRVAALTLLKIPSHVVVYGDWFPLVGYSLAHVIDCGAVHLIIDNFWSTSDGLFSFSFLDYIAVTSIQMRDIWLVALFWKCTFTVYASVVQNRYQTWRPHHGVLAFRGVFIGATSLLTVFSFLRALRFRNSKVIGFDEVPRHAGSMSPRFAPLTSNMSDYGHLLDIKTITIASGLIGGIGLVAQTLLNMYLKSSTRVFTCHNHYVPLSAGTLYPLSAMNVFWYMRLLPQRRSSMIALPRPRLESALSAPPITPSYHPNAVVPLVATPQSRLCDVCNFASAPWNWRPTQVCLGHEKIFTVGARSLEVQSMVRLINIAMLSDPFVFVRLRVIGTPLYLYRLRSAGDPTRTSRRASRGGAGEVIPSGVDHDPSFVDLDAIVYEESFVLSPVVLGDKSTLEPAHELVAVVNSKRVPWTLLVDCG